MIRMMTNKMQKIQEPTLSDYLGVIGLGIVWSWAFIAMRYLSEYLNPQEVAFTRIFIAMIVLGIVIFISGISYKISRADRINIVLYSFLGISLPFLMLTNASQTVSGGMMTLLDTLSPFMGIIIAHFLTKDDKITPYKLIGAVVGFIGVIIAVWDGQTSKTIDLFGGLLVVGAFLFYILSSHIIRKCSHIPPMIFILYSMIVSTITSFLIAMFSNGFSPIGNYHKDNVIPVLIFLGMVPTALAWWYRFILTNKIGYSFIGIAAYIIPISGVITGHLFLGEPLNEYIFISLGLVLCAIWIFSYKNDIKNGDKRGLIIQDEEFLNPLEKGYVRIFVAGASVKDAKHKFDLTHELKSELDKNNLPYVMAGGRYTGKELNQATIVTQKDSKGLGIFPKYALDDLKQECYLLEEYGKESFLISKDENGEIQKQGVGYAKTKNLDPNNIPENCAIIGNKVMIWE